MLGKPKPEILQLGGKRRRLVESRLRPAPAGDVGDLTLGAGQVLAFGRAACTPFEPELVLGEVDEFLDELGIKFVSLPT